MLKTRLSAFLSLLLVFISGAVAGGFVYRFYNPPPHIQRPEDVRRNIVTDMKKALNLDDQQVLQVEKIMDDIRSQGQALRAHVDAEGKKIHDQQVEEIKKILHDDQQPLYEKWRHDRQLERERMERERRSQQQPGGLYKDKDGGRK